MRCPGFNSLLCISIRDKPELQGYVIQRPAALFFKSVWLQSQDRNITERVTEQCDIVEHPVYPDRYKL
jgi:hypothetical protein